MQHCRRGRVVTLVSTIYVPAVPCMDSYWSSGRARLQVWNRTRGRDGGGRRSQEGGSLMGQCCLVALLAGLHSDPFDHSCRRGREERPLDCCPGLSPVGPGLHWHENLLPGLLLPEPNILFPAHTSLEGRYAPWVSAQESRQPPVLFVTNANKMALAFMDSYGRFLRNRV